MKRLPNSPTDHLGRRAHDDFQVTGLQHMHEVAELGLHIHIEPEDVRVVAAVELIASARYNIGRAYYTGVGVDVDDGEAVRWWKLAASEGGPRGCNQAQHALGHFYSVSRRVNPTDPMQMTLPVSFPARTMSRVQVLMRSRRRWIS